MADVKQLVIEYLEANKLMQLATVGSDGPWVCTVWQAFDEDMNIYFFSSSTRRHSQDIANNPKVAGAITKSHEVGEPAQAVQFSGTAARLTNEAEIALARAVYEGRIFDTETIDTFMQHPDKPHAFYKIVPDEFVWFDTINFPDNSRQVYKPGKA